MEVEVKPGGGSGSYSWLDRDDANRIGGRERPRGPVTSKRVGPALEVRDGRHVLAGRQVHDADIVQEDLARDLAKAEVESASIVGVCLSNELEVERTARGLDPDWSGAGATKEHAGADGLAIDQEAWGAGAGIHAHCEVGGVAGGSEGGRASEQNGSGGQESLWATQLREKPRKLWHGSVARAAG